ncbi:MazG nucleotide pyrophosphohydrolase domain-containing protein, partial [Citricoccus sp.]|uniref:MazG nucleotide pyrophosphohydrolase domain-containing protein n=1 Tax=Citricoccus sp. TaxID=1978372 RepID=UPI0026232E83
MSETVDRLVWVVARLREHCPWTRRLTHDALTEYLVEEAYEAVEVIESGPAGAWGAGAVADGTYERLRLELGDVLFQVVLHAAIATDAGGFDLDGAAEAITAKMIRRNPHVFHADGRLRDPEDLAAATIADIERTWERIKRAEREAAGAGPAPQGTTPAPAGAFADLPAALRDPEIDLPSGMDEAGLLEHLQGLAAKNDVAGPNFLGGGPRRHFMPAVTAHLAMQSEFVTSYTPYQPEVAQGLLQAT